MRRYAARGIELLEPHRLVACLHSPLALTLLIGAMVPQQRLVGAVTTEAEGLAKIRACEADVLICTDRLQQGNGGALVAAVKQLPQPPNTLMVVTEPRRLAPIRQALKAGCNGLCLESRIGKGTILQALHSISEGAAYVDQSLYEQYFRSYPDLHDAPLERLSPREVEVLALVAAGYANAAIAADLLIGVETVKTHLNAIRRKLQARDRTHAAVRGIWLGLVDWPEAR